MQIFASLSALTFSREITFVHSENGQVSSKAEKDRSFRRPLTAPGYKRKKKKRESVTPRDSR